MNKELKSCPFCGGTNIDCADAGYKTDVWFVQCDDCGATFPHFDSEQEAKEAWNKRAEVKMKYWDYMSEEEKSEVCRNSGCPYFFGEIDDCMCDEVERSPYDAEEKACYWLKKNYQ